MDRLENQGQADGRQGDVEQESAEVMVKPAALQTMSSCRSLEPHTIGTYTLQMCSEEDSDEEDEGEQALDAGELIETEDEGTAQDGQKEQEARQRHEGSNDPGVINGTNGTSTRWLQRQRLLQKKASARSNAPAPPGARGSQRRRDAVQSAASSPSPSKMTTALLTHAHPGITLAPESNGSSKTALSPVRTRSSPAHEHEQPHAGSALPQQWPSSPDAHEQDPALPTGKLLNTPSPEPPQQRRQRRQQRRHHGRSCTSSPLRMPSSRHIVQSPGWTPTSAPCDTPSLLFGRGHSLAASSNTSSRQSPKPTAHDRGTIRDQAVEDRKATRPLATLNVPQTSRPRTASLSPQKDLVKRAIAYLARGDSCSQEAVAFTESLVLAHRHMLLPSEALMKELLRVYNMDDVDNILSDVELSTLRQAVTSFLCIWWQHQPCVSSRVRKWVHRLERLCVLDGFTHTPAIITEQGQHRPLAPSPVGTHNDYASKSFGPLLKTPARQLAEHLTLLDLEGYRSLTAAEMLDEVWKGSCPAVWRVRNSTLQLSRWVAASVLRQKHRRDRVGALSQWIQVAMELKSMTSFNALFGVVLGITGNAVRRLSETTSLLPTHLVEDLRMLRALKPNGGHMQAYRQLLQEAQCAAEEDPSRMCIPFMGLVFQDLNALHARLLQSRGRSASFCAPEFEIVQDMHAVITGYLQYQFRPMPFGANHQLLADLALATRVHWSNEELLAMSKACEPVLLEGVRCLKVDARERVKMACCGSPAPEAFSAWLQTKDPAAVMKAVQQAGFSVPSRRLAGEDLEGGIKHLANQIFSRYCPMQQHMEPSTWRVVRQGLPLLPTFEDLDEYGEGVVYPHALASYLKEIQLFSTFKCLPHIFERQSTAESLVCDFCSETIRHVVHRCRDCGQSVHGRCRVVASRNCVPAHDTASSVTDKDEHVGCSAVKSSERAHGGPLPRQCETPADSVVEECSEASAHISDASEPFACRQDSHGDHRSEDIIMSAPPSPLAHGRRTRRRSAHIELHRQPVASTSDGRRVLVTMTGTRIRDV